MWSAGVFPDGRLDDPNLGFALEDCGDVLGVIAAWFISVGDYLDVLAVQR